MVGGNTPHGVKRMCDFLDNEEFSDVIIKFGDKQVFAHKVILASGSVWFDRALSGNFSEANKKIIELQDDANPGATMAMLRHLYGASYRGQNLDEDDEDNGGFHLWVFMLGDKYDISTLRGNAAKHFNALILEEKLSDFYSRDTIYAFQKLLGPEAPQFADQALVLSTTNFVLDNYISLVQDSTFRSLLAKGVMLKNDLAMQFLARVGQRIYETTK